MIYCFFYFYDKVLYCVRYILRRKYEKKTLGYILLLVGSGLGLISLVFSPIAMVGCYLLLNEFKSGMGNY